MGESAVVFVTSAFLCYTDFRSESAFYTCSQTGSIRVAADIREDCGMLFSSMVFIWVFLPIVLIGNGILSIIPFHSDRIRIRVKNVFLLICSLVFYAWGGISYLLLMLSVISINYLAGLYIDSRSGTVSARRGLILAIIANIGLLTYFKYFNLIIHTIESIAGREYGSLGIKEVVLPIGISFYIFQAMSYVIDLYRGKTSVQRSILKFALYVSLFPQLIAGPIVIYSDIADQIDTRRETAETFVYGIKRFCFGLAKKVIIANAMAEAADSIWEVAGRNPDAIGAGVAWFGMIAYTLQIYYDFSGYSDMAIGLGSMLGFKFKENFNHPYISMSIREFWRRWHISLSSWFRDYVYIPLGGSRTDKRYKIYRNLLIVFLLTGIWHGANYTFFVWGLFHGILIVMERAFLGDLLDKNRFKFINWLYTILMVMVAWVFFRSDTITEAFVYLSRLFAVGRYSYTVLNFCSMRILIALIAAILCMGILDKPVNALKSRIKDNALASWGSYIIQMALLIYSVILIISGTYNPFIYFRF